MRFSNLADIIKRYGKIKSDTLIIIPLLQEYDALSKHLDFLSQQSSKNFDVILLLNQLSDESKVLNFLDKNKFDFSIILSKRKEDTGSAGGFFTGQKYALEEKYNYMIMADVDCMPIDKQLIENLLKHKDKDYVGLSVNSTVEGKRVGSSPASVVSWYSLISTRLVKKYGLYFMPLYFGGDDLEYMERIGVSPYIIPNRARHADTTTVCHSPERYWLYILNMVATSKISKHFAICLLTIIMQLPIFLMFSPQYGKKLHNSLLMFLLTCSYGKKVAEKIKRTGFQKYIVQKDNFKDFKILKYGADFGNSWSLKLLTVIKQTLRKNVIVEQCNFISVSMLITIFSKKVLFKVGKDRYLLTADNSNLLFHILKLLLLSVYLPIFVVFISTIYIPLKILKQPNTMRYGLD